MKEQVSIMNLNLDARSSFKLSKADFLSWGIEGTWLKGLQELASYWLSASLLTLLSFNIFSDTIC
jgi:hypothetical protein